MECATQTLGATGGVLPFDRDGVSPCILDHFHKIQRDIKTVTEKIHELLTTKPHIIQGKLNESDVPPEISWSLLRTYIVRCYNALEEQKSLALLEEKNSDHLLSTKPLNSLAEEYWKDLTKDRDKVFGMYYPPFQEAVLPSLRTLSTRRLTNLSLHILRNRRERLENQLSRDVEAAQEEHAFFLKRKELMNRDPKEFPPGDFSFVIYEMERRIYTEAYAIVEKEEAWDLFRIEPPSKEMDYALFCLNHSQLSRIVSLIDAKLGMSGCQMSIALSALRDIATLGWAAYVQKRLDTHKAEVAKGTLPHP